MPKRSGAWYLKEPYAQVVDEVNQCSSESEIPFATMVLNLRTALENANHTKNLVIATYSLAFLTLCLVVATVALIYK